MSFNLPYTAILDSIEDDNSDFNFFEKINYEFEIYSHGDLEEVFLDIFNHIKKHENFFYSKTFEDYCNGLIFYYQFIGEKIKSRGSSLVIEMGVSLSDVNEVLYTYTDFTEYVKGELQRYYTYKRAHILDPFDEKEKGVNVPYKIAMLDELNVLGMLKGRYKNADIYRIIQFIVGGNIDNVKDYYNSIYGNYSGNNQIDPDHRTKAKDICFK